MLILSYVNAFSSQSAFVIMISFDPHKKLRGDVGEEDYNSHFKDERTEAQGSKVIFPKVTPPFKCSASSLRTGKSTAPPLGDDGVCWI